MSKKKIVWISPHLPYDKVDHASGKIQNYYMKKLIELGQYDIRLISFFKPEELKLFTMNKLIKCDLNCYYNKSIKKILRNLLDFNYLINPFHKFANSTTKFLQLRILKALKIYKANGYVPNIIILHHTQTILFVDMVKKIFPTAKVIGIEEDVTLLSCQRKIDLATKGRDKKIAELRFKNMEREEIKALKQCDLIILNNYKDKKILQNYGFSDRLRVWTPYFDNMSSFPRILPISHDILFYGAMSRPENYLSVQWFMEKVKPLLNDTDIKYYIVGGNPNYRLKQYESNSVRITGFVEDIKPFFQNSLCLVAPLVLGAGIKIKVLEALSSGLPVLTNQIGIEGIPATDGVEYYFCTEPEEYATMIRQLLSNDYNFVSFEKNAKSFIADNFNYETSTQQFKNWIREL